MYKICCFLPIARLPSWLHCYVLIMFFFIEEAGQGFDASYFRMLGFNKWDTKEWDTLVTNCRGNIQTVLIQYLIYKIGIYKPSSNANSYYSLLILRKLRAESVHKSNIAHRHIPSPSGHANTGIIFFCIGISQWCSYNNQPILIGCSTLSQEYWKLIFSHRKLMSRQLGTLTCPITLP